MPFCDLHAGTAISKKSYEAGFEPVANGKQKKPVDDTKVSYHFFKVEYLVLKRYLQPRRDRFSGLSRKAKRRKMAMEDNEEMGDGDAVNAAIRSAKKAARPAKIGVPEKRAIKSKGKKSKTKATKGGRGGAFDRDLGQRNTGGEGHEGVRAKKGDAIGGMNRKKGGKRK